mgnify:CR=1 FL=1
MLAHISAEADAGQKTAFFEASSASPVRAELARDRGQVGVGPRYGHRNLQRLLAGRLVTELEDGTAFLLRRLECDVERLCQRVSERGYRPKTCTPTVAHLGGATDGDLACLG